MQSTTQYKRKLNGTRRLQPKIHQTFGPQNQILFFSIRIKQVPVVSAWMMPARRTFKSRNTPSTVLGLYWPPPPASMRARLGSKEQNFAPNSEWLGKFSDNSTRTACGFLLIWVGVLAPRGGKCNWSILRQIPVV